MAQRRVFHDVFLLPSMGHSYIVLACASPQDITYFHINLESWVEDYPQLWMDMQSRYPLMAPKNLGLMGYHGRTSRSDERTSRSSGLSDSVFRNRCGF